VAKYLRNRTGGAVAPYKFLREHLNLRYPGTFESHPAMVAKIVSAENTAVNLHLTFLDRNGGKAEVSQPKRVMPGRLPDGCAIRLMEEKPLMGIAEGIETAISASLMFDIPVWACINGNLLSKWTPPLCAEEIIIFGDNDKNYTGQAKAYHLANRLEVQFKRHVTVQIPEFAGDDWNDVHVAHNQAQRGAGHV
jgi:putative DNA primase/helicase